MFCKWLLFSSTPSTTHTRTSRKHALNPFYIDVIYECLFCNFKFDVNSRLFQIPSNETVFGHPIMWQELFSPNTEAIQIVLEGISKILPHTFTIEALSKLLMYGNYAKAKAEAQSTPVTVGDIVVKELDRYPYTRKTDTVDPYFPPTDLKGTYPDVNFRAGITDAGMMMKEAICSN